MQNCQLPSKYTTRIIAFIDVLGFKALIEKSEIKGSVGTKTISQIVESIDRSLEELEALCGGNCDLVFTQFSDSFVISIDAKGAGKYGVLNFTMCIGYLLDCFLASYILLRGGITCGKLIHTKNMLFGPAMNRAYELESSFAKVPRVIIDPNLPKLLNSKFNFMLNIKKDFDGLFYIDYFTPQKVFYLIPHWQYVIQTAIENVPSNENLIEKRDWLKSKYNISISNFKYEEFKEKLDAYVDDCDANNAVIVDYKKLLDSAKLIRKFR